MNMELNLSRAASLGNQQMIVETTIKEYTAQLLADRDKVIWYKMTPLLLRGYRFIEIKVDITKEKPNIGWTNDFSTDKMVSFTDNSHVDVSVYTSVHPIQLAVRRLWRRYKPYDMGAELKRLKC